MVEFSRYIPSRRVSIGIGLILILMVSGLGFVVYQSQTRQFRNELEQSDFIVRKLDIVNSTESTLIAIGTAEIVGNLTSSQSSNFEIVSITLDLYNESEDITSVTIPISQPSLDGKINFEIAIPVDADDPSELTSTILVDILLGNHFSIDFQGTIKYQYLGIDEKLSFHNHLQFMLDQPALELELDHIDLPPPNQSNGSLEFSIFNPFSISISAIGNITVLLQDQNIGTIELTSREFPSNWTSIAEEIQLAVDNPTLLDLYFEQISDPVILQTSLTLGFGNLYFNLTPDLELDTGGLDLDFGLTALNSLNADYFTGRITSNVNGTITSHLPMALNITAITGTITTNDENVGTFQWEDNNSILLSPDVSQNFYFVAINSTISQLPQFTGLFSGFGFSNMFIKLYLDGELFEYSIDSYNS